MPLDRACGRRNFALLGRMPLPDVTAASGRIAVVPHVDSIPERGHPHLRAGGRDCPSFG